MSPDVASWKCRCCGFERWHNVTVKRKNGALYETSFYACSGCSVMFLNPAQFNADSTAAPNIELPKVVRIRAVRNAGNPPAARHSGAPRSVQKRP